MAERGEGDEERGHHDPDQSRNPYRDREDRPPLPLQAAVQLKLTFGVVILSASMVKVSIGFLP